MLDQGLAVNPLATVLHLTIESSIRVCFCKGSGYIDYEKAYYNCPVIIANLSSLARVGRRGDRTTSDDHRRIRNDLGQYPGGRAARHGAAEQGFGLDPWAI